MESWSELVVRYPEDSEPADLAKALRAAEALLSTDLAPYELVWVFRTLLYKPIEILEMIKIKKNNEDWLKNLSDCFKLLGKLCSEHWNMIENESIVQLCLLPYDAKTRSEALLCLNKILCNPGAVPLHTKRIVAALETASSCKAPLALLVGTLCRYHPERVDQEYTRIWRIYLRMLQPENRTDTVVNAVLQGIDGLFENFGKDLPIQEIQDFYKDFSRKCAKIPKCIDPLLSILKAHAGLFKERLAEDKVLRMYVWGINNSKTTEALLSVYRVIFEDMTPEKIKEIMRSEIEQKLTSNSNQDKHTALHILYMVKSKYGISSCNVQRPDELEFNLRRRPLNRQDAELVPLYLQSGENYRKSLILSVITYFKNMPETLRVDVLVNAVSALYAEQRDHELAKIAVSKLIDLSADNGLEMYCDVWRGLLQPEKEYSNNILKESIDYIIVLIKRFLDSTVKDVYEVLSVTSLLAFILSVSETNDHDYERLLRPFINELSSRLWIDNEQLLQCRFVCVEMCKDILVLRNLRYCLNTYPVLKETTVMQNRLVELKGILSDDTMDAKILAEAVSKLDHLLEQWDSTDAYTDNVLKLTQKFKFIKDVSTKENRILLQNVNMCLGKHALFLTKEDFTGELYGMDLKNKIIFNIPNMAEGTTYKMDILRILQIAIIWPDKDVLYCLLVIITANLRDRPDPNLSEVSWCAVHALMSCSETDVTSLLLLCASEASVRRAMQSIREETDLEVRKRLCECLNIMVQENPGTDTSAELLRVVANGLFTEQYYLRNFDVTRVFINNLEQNDDLTLEYLPRIIVASSRSRDKELFMTATALFNKKIDIFDDNSVKNVIKNIIKCLKDDNNVEFYKTYVLEFLKAVYEVKKYSFEDLIHQICDGIEPIDSYTAEDVDKALYFTSVLQILSLSKTIFVFEDDVSKKMIVKDDFLLIKYILKTSESVAISDTNLNTILKDMLSFLKEYAPILLEMQNKLTIQSLKLITVLVLQNGKSDVGLFECLSTYKTILQNIPIEVIDAYKTWLNNAEHDIHNITDSLVPCASLTPEHFVTIHALHVASKIFKVPIPVIESWTARMVEINANLIYDPESTVLLLEIAEKHLSVTEFEDVLKNNMDLVQKYISVYFEKILEATCVLDYCMLIDFFKYCSNHIKVCENRWENIFEVIEKNWSAISPEDFDKKLSIAIQYFNLKKVAPSMVNEVECITVWAMEVIANKDICVDDKIKIITVMPGGVKYSSCYRHMAGLLPTRISEVRGDSAAVFRALLDSLSATGDDTVLDIVVTLAAGDDTKGWWDYAIDACLSDLNQSAKLPIVYQAYSKRPRMVTWQRVFLPLLRHSPRGVCEEFVCTIICDILAIFKTGFKEPSNTEFYKERVLSYTRAFLFLQVVFEKLMSKSLESGIINKSAGSQDLWYVVKQACLYSVTLRDKVRCPDDAGDSLRDACLAMQCAAYNCLATAICKRSPSQKQYTCVFDVHAWAKIVDVHAEYEFKPRATWTELNAKRSSHTSSASTTSSTSTARTKIFMGTLSENPLHYDMIPLNEEEEEPEEQNNHIYDSHPLDTFGCLSVITSLLQDSSCLEHTEWVGRVVSALESQILHVNAKWLLAQAICNVEENLKPHAIILAPALLAMVASTSKIVADKGILNNLHIDMLWTVLKWKVLELKDYRNLNKCVENLISTCIEYKSQENVSKRLMSTLNSLLETYGTNVQISWNIFETHCNELPNSASYLLPIWKRILKNGIIIPNLITTILAKFDAKLWHSTSKLPEVFGTALAVETIKGEYLARFWQVLATLKSSNIRGFVKVLLYSQRKCYECCNDFYFRTITDLAPKTETSKCLMIMSVYLDNMKNGDTICEDIFETIGLRELLLGEYAAEAMKVVHGGFKFMNEQLRNDCMEKILQNTRSHSLTIRKQAYSVVNKVFQDITSTKDDHPSKRRALDTTPLLAMMRSTISYHRLAIEGVARGLFDDDEDIVKEVQETLQLCLSKEISIRFVELFYIIFYLTKTVTLEMTDYGYMFLNLLFKDLLQQQGFKELKLSDRPMPSGDTNISRLTYKSGKFVQKKSENVKSINVEMPIADILETLIKSAKTNPNLSESLCVLTSVMALNSGPRFDVRASIGEMPHDILLRGPSCVTPFVLEVSRMFFDGGSYVEELKQTINSLKQKVLGTDAVHYCNVVYEDVLLKTQGRNLFDFRITEDEDIEMFGEKEHFTITGLTRSFGALSNWEDLREQDRSRLEEFLPPLITDRRRFETALQYYFEDKKHELDYSLWFHKLLGSYISIRLREPILQCRENWLRDIQKWPSKAFVDTCIVESVQWYNQNEHYSTTVASFAYPFNPTDCLAEWAARIMLRTAFYCNEPDEAGLCRFSELAFCREIIRRRLPQTALLCISRNKEYLPAEEAVPWFELKVAAQRLIALKQDNKEMLEIALEAVEQQDTGNNLTLKKLTMQLKNDLNALPTPNLENILIKEYDRKKNATDLKEIIQITMNYYYDQWENSDTSTQESILVEITDIISRCLNFKRISVDCEFIITMLLYNICRFNGILNEDTAKKILQEFNAWQSSNFIQSKVSQINALKNKFPSEVWSEYMSNKDSVSLDVCKKYFTLIHDTQYTMIHFCDTLLYTKDAVSWQTTYNNMKEKILNKNFSGTEYISLNTIKNKLLAIENSSDEEKRKVLVGILDELRLKPQRVELRLSQLCPELCTTDVLEEQKHNINKLLDLQDAYVVKFHEKVRVFTDSIRRPCVITALLSNGTTKKYIIKTGEPLSVDSSIQRCMAVLPKIYSGMVRTYNVTILSEDSAIIEYLTDYKRLRETMGSSVDIPVNRLDDDKLVLSPGLALEQYNAMCNKLPVYALRSAIENNCASTEEFIKKRRCFLETLASMTMVNWIFGVGDRHLQNIMMNVKDGGVCGIDWASAFEYGRREYMPARLTGNLLAVCDVKLLEGRLQRLLECLRENYRQYEAYIMMNFYWKNDFKEMNYISNILRGKAVSYEITRLAIETSNLQRKDDVINILDASTEYFCFKETYSVEEQITCLLQHCTNPKLLSIIPRGWEPWA